MRVLLHDYGGYPFPFDLSRELAKRGHNVTHLYAGFTLNGSKRQAEEQENLHIRPINLRKPLQKSSYVARWSQEVEYGKLVAKEIWQLRPDVVIYANSPLDVLKIGQRTCKRISARFIFWFQDSIGLATQTILRKQMGTFGSLVGNYYLGLEKNLARQSDGVVLITEDFEPLLERAGIEPRNIKVIPNWAPIAEIPVLPLQNPWAESQGIAGKFSFVYTGTLGMKHKLEILLQLALDTRSSPDVCLVVVSEGAGADWLKQKGQEYSLDNMLVLPIQPAEVYPSVLASASVLVAILEREAGLFSVPSKVLTYMCAQRALLLAVPENNLAARIVSQNKTGLVTSPDDLPGFIQAAKELMLDAPQRETYARNARRYAEEHFDIKKIADQFEEVMIGSR